MARLSWKIRMGFLLLLASMTLFILHYLIFHDLQTLEFYLALDIVFVPVQVLLVTFIIERLLGEREKKAMLAKLNMVIGAFFSEMGGELIRRMSRFCMDFGELSEQMQINSHWKEGDYKAAGQFIRGYECRLSSTIEDLEHLRTLLMSKRAFVLGLLQNPNLLEHDDFTDLLWALCHLTEELEARTGLADLPAADLKHLDSDVKRAFSLLIREWLAYMQHLSIHYPYMYSLAIRLNPLQPDSSPVVTTGA